MKFDNITKIKLIFFLSSLYFFPIITLFYFSRGLNTFQAVSLEGFLIMAVLISEIPTGIIADRIGRKHAITILLGLFIIGNVITIYAQTYSLFIIVQFIFGIGIAFGSGAIEALVYDSLASFGKEKEMSKVWGSINFYGLVAMIIAAIIGGYIARNHDPKLFVMLIWLFVIFSSFAFIMSFFVKEKYPKKELTKENPLILFKESTRSILKNKSLKKIIYLTVMTQPFVFILLFLFQPYFLIAKVNNSIYGIAVALGLIFGAILIKYAYKIEKQIGMKKTIFLTTILPGLLYFAMVFLIGPIISVAWYILMQGFMKIREPLFSQYQNDHINSYNRATVLSIISMITSFYLVIMRFAIGAISNHNLLLGFIIMGLIITISSVIFRIDETSLA